MNKIKLTPAQTLAVSRKSSLLVSAAAGSGKTRVLTQRLLAYVTDEEEPYDINEFLVITYTRAAAAELRSRILEELSALAGENPQNRRYRRQNTLCYSAPISTIHGFCANILRENCHKLGLAPDFSVGDEDKCRQLKLKALDKTLEAAYETIEENAGFAALSAGIGSGRDDSRLEKTVLDLHEKMQSHPYPEKWMREQMSLMRDAHFNDVGNTPWGEQLMQDAAVTASFWSQQLDGLWFGICKNEQENAPLIKAYGESILETMDGLRNFSRALSKGWDSAVCALPIAFPNLKPLKNYEFEERKRSFAALRDVCKKSLGELSLIFDGSSEKTLHDLQRTFPAMLALPELTLEFDRQYSAEKRRRGILDFSDLEHYAVTLLCDEKSGEPTDIAREISQRYREILVDEFQDVNAVQDLIFRCISKDESNLFMVGDVKQSIYRFRLADPNIFLNRLAAYKSAAQAEENEPASVLLQQNFRSDRAILSACNSVFEALMSKELGDIAYNADCALYPPEDAPAARGKAVFTIISAEGEDEERPDKIAIEASFVARQIKELVSSGKEILDGGVPRPVRYGDIAILLRSPNSAGGAYKTALAQAGVPVSSQQGGSFFTAPEVVVLTALLTVIDNPHRDVPLTAVLASPVFGFTADELSQIRAANRKSDFFTALCSFSSESEKCAQFVKTLNELRALSYDLSVGALLTQIYDRLELPALWTAILGSGAGTENLLLYSQLAAGFENGGFRGVAEFLGRLETMQERGVEPGTSGNKHDCVQILSIHKSKGLEFPVVFLADTSRRFNKTDLSDPVLVHPRLGFGSKLTDLERGIEFPSIAHRAIKARLGAELLSEEMRVAYVALTRAKELLYISCTDKNPAALIEKIETGLTSPPSPELLRRQSSPAQWLLSASLANPENAPEIIIADPKTLDNEAVSETQGTEIMISEAELAFLREKLDYRYPYEYACVLPSKLTATSLASSEKDEDARQLIPERSRTFDLPDVFGAQRKLTAGEKGVATHTVMQFINFERTGNLEDIELEVQRIAALGQLNAQQAAAVNRKSILKFFQSEIGQRICQAKNILREFRFSLLVDAADFYPEAGDEKLLLQGVVDCCIEDGDELTIVDYKTDNVTAETLETVSEHYRPQLQAYALALSRITGKPVKSCLLCFLQAGIVKELA